MIRKIAFIAILTWASSCPAQDQLRITSPANGTVVSNGQTIVITVVAGAGVKVSMVSSDLGTAHESSPGQYPLKINGSIGQHQLTAIGQDKDGNLITSAALTLDVESSLQVVSITTDPTSLSFSRVGGRLPLGVLATYSDGSTGDISSSAGTKYVSADTNIATVDQYGTVTSVGAGQTTITVTTSTASVKVSVTVQNAPPSAAVLFIPHTHATLSPAANAAGWNNTAVTVTLSASETLYDPSAQNTTPPTIQTIQYALQGSQTGTINGSTGTISISTEGVQELAYYSIDSNSFQEGTQFLNIQIDETPPNITGVFAPAPNANGWNNTPVTVNFPCIDTLSGLAPGSPPAATVISREGKNQQVTGSCSDLAGNTASAIVNGINIDKTAPDAYNVFVPASQDIAVFGKDDLSGVAPGALVPTSDVPVDEHRSDRKYELRTFQFSDLAGNQTVLTEKIGKRGGSVSASLETIQYGSGEVHNLPRNEEHFDWVLNADGSLKELRQELTADREDRQHHVEARYTSASNQTVIHEEGFERRDSVKPGLVLLQMTTQDGQLHIQF